MHVHVCVMILCTFQFLPGWPVAWNQSEAVREGVTAVHTLQNPKTSSWTELQRFYSHSRKHMNTHPSVATPTDKDSAGQSEDSLAGSVKRLRVNMGSNPAVHLNIYT